MRENYAHIVFNRGLISKLALARQDIKRVTLSAEIHTNWMPRVLGSMMLRPGLAYIGSTKDNAVAVHLPFIFAIDDVAAIELTANFMRVRVDDLVITRLAVSTAITNGEFTANVTGWTDSDDSGATSAWATGGYLALLGDDTNYAKRDQEITVASADQNVEHGLQIIIERGPVELKVGTSQGDDSYWSTTLDTGAHSLAITPTGNFWIRLQSRLSYTTLVDTIAIEAAGAMIIATNWDEDDLVNIRDDQSGDIIFNACKNQRQQKIERRSIRSWSVVNYETNDGPFMLQNTGATTIATNALEGDVTLTASNDIFTSGHVGALFTVSSEGQLVEEDVTVENNFSDAIRIVSIESSRIFSIIIEGTWVSTVTLQRSIEEEGNWEDVETYTANVVKTVDDGLDNQIVYYRIGVKTGDFTSGTVELTLRYTSGSITGIARILTVATSLSATASVLKAFGGLAASDDWAEGLWSDKRGWPSAVNFNEGRLFWAGKDKILGSISDSFYSFDADVIGDSGHISRSIGSGPVDNINWLISTKTLLVGGQAAIKSARSSSLEEILTPTNFNLKDVTTQGAASISAVKVDKQAIFAQASGVRIYEIGFDNTVYDHSNLDLTAIIPEICEPAVVKIVVQRQPDTRLHFIRSDGKVAILIYDKVEEVKCWILFETDGLVEDALVLPGTIEDSVYYVVNRTINGLTKRYYEKWTLESESRGGIINKLADSHYIYSGASTTTITGLGHLEGESVVVWGNSKNLGTFTVTSSQITNLPESVTYAVIGLGYTADWKSAKNAIASSLGTSLLQKKQITQLGVILADTHAQGLKYGPDFENLDDLPTTEKGKIIEADYLWEAYDEEAFSFPGIWNTDSRLCLRATAPKPCTILAAIVSWNTHEKG